MKDDCGSDQGQSSRSGLLNQCWKSAASNMGWIYPSRIQSQGDGQLAAGSGLPHSTPTVKKQCIYCIGDLNVAPLLWQGGFWCVSPLRADSVLLVRLLMAVLPVDWLWLSGLRCWRDAATYPQSPSTPASLSLSLSLPSLLLPLACAHPSE